MLPGVIAVNRVGRLLFVTIREDAIYLTPLIRRIARQAGGHAVFNVVPTRPNPHPSRADVKRWIRHLDGVEQVRLIGNTFHVVLWDDTYKLRETITDMAAQVGCNVVFESQPFSWPADLESLREEIAGLEGVESSWLDGDEIHVSLWDNSPELREEIERIAQRGGAAVYFDEAPHMPEGEVEELYNQLLQHPAVESVLVEDTTFFVSLREDTPEARAEIQRLVSQIEGGEVVFDEIQGQPDPKIEQLAQQLKGLPEVQSVSFDEDGVYVVLREGSDRPEVRARLEQIAKSAEVGVLFQTAIEAAVDAVLQLPGVVGAQPDAQGVLQIHADQDTPALRKDIQSALYEVAPHVRYALSVWKPADPEPQPEDPNDRPLDPEPEPKPRPDPEPRRPTEPEPKRDWIDRLKDWFRGR